MIKRYIVLIRRTLKKTETYASTKQQALSQVAYAEQQPVSGLFVLEILPCA